MKLKRALAVVLCAALLSSEGLGMNAFAAEMTGTGADVYAETEGEKQNTEGVSEQSPDVTPIATETPSALPEESPAATTAPDVTPEATETPSALPEESPTATADPAEIPDETPEASGIPSAMPDEISDAVPEETGSPEKLLEHDQTIMDTGLTRASTDFLEVDDEGVLKVKEGTEIYGSSVTIPKEAKTIPKDQKLFAGNKTIKNIYFEAGSKLTEIEAGAFEGSGILSITIPDGVTEIKAGVFKNSALTTIMIHDKVTAIGDEAFQDTDLTSFSAAGVTTVGKNAFLLCDTLSTVNMPKLETIGEGAFRSCTKLNSGMVWGKNLSSISSDAFKGCGFTSFDMSAVSGEITIGSGAFEDCTKLSAVVLPEGLKEISTALFKGCTVLSSVTIPDKAETTVIREEAFLNCKSLKRIQIPEAVKQICARAFENCSSLTVIIISNKNPKGDDFIIAQDAFPNRTDNSGITMKGYDGKVQEYAENRGYTYESLYEKHEIKWNPNDHVSVIANVNEAYENQEILVTVTVKQGYCLTGAGFEVTCDRATVVPELVSTSGSKSVFRFLMPDGVAVINVLTAPVADATKGDMTYDFKAVDGYIAAYDVTNKQLTFDKTGQSTALIVRLDDHSVGAWLVKYTSSNPSVVSVSDKGILCAKKKGTATVTATLKDNSKQSVSFKVKVEGDATVGSIQLVLGEPYRATLKTEMIPDENGDETEYTVVEYNKATLAAGARSFSVSFQAFEKDRDENLLVNAKWTSVDSSIATVKSATSTDNTNTITVKKGVEGETTVTVTVKNADETVCTESFIIRVVDATPRLADTKISVNSNSDRGTVFDLVPVYGYEINDENTIQVCKRVVSSGIVSYEPVNGLAVDYVDGEFYLRATDKLEIGSGKTLTYKGNSSLYLRGEFDKTGDIFLVRIPEMSVVNKTLNPSVQTKGKINLFYNHIADVEEQGSVTITQSLKNEKVKSYQLVSEANHKKQGSEAEDSFAANFDVEKKDDGSALITRSDRETLAQTKNGKNVVSGYLYIYYEGYDEPVKKKITVPTCNTKPNLELSMSSATASVYQKDQSYTIYLRDKKTKKKYALHAEAKVYFNDTSTTEGVFDPSALTTGLSDGDIVVRVKEKPDKGKAVIKVQNTSWGSALQYTFNLKTTSTHPAVKTSSTKLVLNTLCAEQPAELTATVSSEEAVFAGFARETLVYSGNKKYQAYAQELIDEMIFSESGLEVSLPKESIKAMTYNFKIKPQIRYTGTNQSYIMEKQISFSVTIKDNTPTFKPAKTSFSLNVRKPGIETVEAAYSIQNIPEGVSYQIHDDGMKLTPIKSKAGEMIPYIHVEIDDENGKLTVRLDEKTPIMAFSYEYYVEGLKVQVGKKSIGLNKFKIKVTGVNKAPSLSVSGKGTINPVNEESSIVYTAKVNYIVSEIEEVRIWEFTSDDQYYLDGEGKENDNRTSEHFTVELTDGNKAVVKAKDGVTLKASTTYRIQLAYKLKAAPDNYQVTKIFSVKPVQTLPKIKTDRSSAYLYAGQNRPKTIAIQLTKTSVKDAEIVDVVFAKNTPDSIRKAYRVSYNEETGKATLTLVNPASVVLNKKYTITLETKCKNQMENSTGTTFKINVTVRK